MDITPYISLLQTLVQTPSLSGEEERTADHIRDFLEGHGIPTRRIHNNIIARNSNYKSDLPTIILNSHHDTVGVGRGWTKDAHSAEIIDGCLYGRGSNDAGGALVSLIAAFCHYYNHLLPFNLVLIASAEEENFGAKGVSSVLDKLESTPSFGIIGEPTEMQLGIAEKGLIVIDAISRGKSGHAARDTGINAIYLALEDIEWIRRFKWDKVSEVLGETKTTVTQINAGSQHNMVPDECTFVIDCRVNEHYSLDEVFTILNAGTHSELLPRSLRWHPSGLRKDHPIIRQGVSLGRKVFGSPTLSDQVHFKCPTIKIGPGKSERSHTSDEFIRLSEIEEGIRIYIDLLSDLQIEKEV